VLVFSAWVLPRNTWGVCVCVCVQFLNPLALADFPSTSSRGRSHDRNPTEALPDTGLSAVSCSTGRPVSTWSSCVFDPMSMTPVDCQGWLSEKFELLTSVGSEDFCTKKAAWISQSCSLRSMVPRAKKNVSDHPHCLLTGRHRQGHASANGWKETTSV